MAPGTARERVLGRCVVLLGLLGCAAGNWINGESGDLPVDVDHGLIIDAGSSGSRMHVYQWAPRVFSELPPSLTYPKTNSLWTDREKPGLSTLARTADLATIEATLKPLLEFAMDVLADKKDRWQYYPIYLKATGGMRELPNRDRALIMDAVRDYLGDNATCPFYFRRDFARVISGEEEAIFGWTAINFLMGELLPQSAGVGTVDPNVTWGALDMGGASTQISFFRPDQDILANLFKLQIGDQKHWNVYAHSFLYFGRHSARDRFVEGLADGQVGGKWIDYVVDADIGGWNRARFDEPILGSLTNATIKRVARQAKRDAQAAGENQTTLRTRAPHHGAETRVVQLVKEANHTGHESIFVADPCLPEGFVMDLETRFTKRTVHLEGALFPGKGSRLAACLDATLPLLRLEANKWCDFVHTHQCSLGGVYQPRPPVDSSTFGNYFAFAQYTHVWEDLKLPMRASLREVADRASDVCDMSWEDLKTYAMDLVGGDPKKFKSKLEFLHETCWLSSYTLQLLHTAYGFPMDTNFTVTSELQGHKVGWALGAMLYEINTLPWGYDGPRTLKDRPSESIYLYSQMITLVAALLAVAVIYLLCTNPYHSRSDTLGTSAYLRGSRRDSGASRAGAEGEAARGTTERQHLLGADATGYGANA